MNNKNKKAIVRKFPDFMIQQRQGTFGKSLNYVGGAGYINRLNEVFDFNWSFECVDRIIDWNACEVIVLGQLSANGIIKQQYGNCAIKFPKDTPHKPENAMQLGDDIKAAATDALKKCASLFGIGLHLHGSYEKEWLAALFKDSGSSVQEPDIDEESPPECETTHDEEPEPTGASTDGDRLKMAGPIESMQPMKKYNNKKVCNFKVADGDTGEIYNVGIWGTDGEKVATNFEVGNWVEISYSELINDEKYGWRLKNPEILAPSLNDLDVKW